MECEAEMLCCSGSASYRVVPWKSWDEWSFVTQSLFSSSPDSIAAATKRISAWRSRGHLPIVIEVTASIIGIQQRDPFFREGLHDIASNSEEMLVMLYCMAIMRLVNGVVEKTRKKAEVSIAVEADRIGLPRMLIDIRHETSHRDLPSLQLVRLASIKALNWLKSYYWEPQKNLIPFQRDRTAEVRKEIKLKLRELAFYLNQNQASQFGSLPTKRKRMKQFEVVYGRRNFFFHKAGKLRGSNSQGPKGQARRALRILVQLYSSFPSDVVVVLLEFLVKALGSQDGNEVKPPDNAGVEHISGNLKTSTCTIDTWKLIITRFSSKEPELILVMLKEILEMIQTREAMESENGKENLSWFNCEARRNDHLSSLVLWLIEKFKRNERHSRIVCAGESATHDFSDKTNARKVTLTKLLKKFLLLFSTGNGQLPESVLLLAEMTENSLMIERLKRLSLLSFPKLCCVEGSSTQMCTENSVIEQELSITRAQEKLDHLKLLRGIKDKAESVGVNDGVLGKEESRWRVAKSWKPCPIGMLPSAFHSAGVIPVLDKAFDIPEVQQASESHKDVQDSSCDVEALEDSNATKKLRITDKNGPEDDHGDSPMERPIKGRLLIDGVLKKAGAEELLAIESAVRILV